jgi:hypothetical protein
MAERAGSGMKNEERHSRACDAVLALTISETAAIAAGSSWRSAHMV